mmetsp:Transcript_39609/g.60612  ORF Transcript_39609/g.60612 Transcript_39609/m.60612 type:complete len:349 (+) Transcript_39609:2686-3732(+)
MIRFWPVYACIMLISTSLVYFVGNGVAWTEMAALVQECEEYWWANFIYVNDVVPYWVKDFKGCLRVGAIFAIDMKLFVLVPFASLLYVNRNLKLLLWVLSLLIGTGLILHWFFLIYYEINPGYLNIADFEGFDMYVLKPWNYIDSYYLGVLLAVFYLEYLRLKENSGTSRFDRFCHWVSKDGLSSYILLLGFFTFFTIFVALHHHIGFWSMIDRPAVIFTDREEIVVNAFIMSVAKVCCLISFACLMIMLLSGRMKFMQNMLSSSYCSILSKVIFEATLVLPFVARSFLGSMNNSYNFSPTFPFMIMLFSISVSFVVAVLINIFVNQPLNDCFMKFWKEFKLARKEYL